MRQHEDRRGEIDLDQKAAAGRIDFTRSGRRPHQAVVGNGPLAGVVHEDGLKLLAEIAIAGGPCGGEVETLARQAQIVVEALELAGAGVHRADLGDGAFHRVDLGNARAVLIAATQRRTCQRGGACFGPFQVHNGPFYTFNLAFLAREVFLPGKGR